MGYYIGSQGYYEGDKANANDTAVPQRPSSLYDWVSGAWVINAARQAAANAATTAATQDSTDLAAVKADSTLISFVNMTPAQVDTWITNNVTSLATATTALRILAKIVLVVARKSLR